MMYVGGLCEVCQRTTFCVEGPHLVISEESLRCIGREL